MGASSSADTYVNYSKQIREVIEELSVERCYANEIDSISTKIQTGQTAEALADLLTLKAHIDHFIVAVCGLLRQFVESDQQRWVEITMLGHEVIDGARAYALLSGNVEGLAHVNQLDNMDNFVAAYIADLDPDRE